VQLKAKLIIAMNAARLKMEREGPSRVFYFEAQVPSSCDTQVWQTNGKDRQPIFAREGNMVILA
jgi:hypothetical protein